MQKKMIIFAVLATSFSSCFSARGKPEDYAQYLMGVKIATPILLAVGGAIETAVREPNAPVIRGAVKGAAWGVLQVVASDMLVKSRQRKETNFYDVSSR